MEYATLSKKLEEAEAKLSRGMLFEQWVDTHVLEGVKVTVFVGGKAILKLQPLAQDRYNIQFLAIEGVPFLGIEPLSPVSIRKQAIDLYSPG